MTGYGPEDRGYISVGRVGFFLFAGTVSGTDLKPSSFLSSGYRRFLLRVVENLFVSWFVFQRFFQLQGLYSVEIHDTSE
jgi:hypothetical protein